MNDNRRILLVDDNEAIHADFRKILSPGGGDASKLDAARAALFGAAPAAATGPCYELTSAHQGQEALELVRAALWDGRPFAAAFIDVRMPPGWDGVETIGRIWKEYPELQVVICTAYSDYSWDDVQRALGESDRLLILKKPFDNVEVRQLALALTAKWRTERDARLKHDELENMVEDRTRELREVAGKLDEARQSAEEANRAKSAFLANVSHEIRTPMTAILGHADLLLEARQAEVERALSLKSIQRNCRHLLQLINDILDLSKIESGKLGVERIECSPCQVLAEVASLTRVQAIEKGLDFSINYDGRIPRTIRSDPTRLRQILVNLVGNAIKFTPRGSVEVVCGLEAGDDSAPALRFDVRDTGVGLNPAQTARLFQPFVQADTSTTRTHGGTGLGLSISKRLAEALDGGISLVSASGAGATFTLRIGTGPLAGVAMLDDPHEATILVTSPTVLSEQRAGECPLSGRRVLLAEDGPDNQYLISLHLRRAGAEVTLAANGREAVDAVSAAKREGRPFELVVMDIQMPELDGFGAASLLRQDGFSGPIVALTANAMQGDRQKCLRAGFDDYCTKPVDFEQLLQVAAAHLRQCARDQSAAEAPTAGTVFADETGNAEPLRSEFADDPDMADALAYYVDRLPRIAEELQAAFASGERDELARVLHQLKGSAGSYGFPTIGESARAAEAAVRGAAEEAELSMALECIAALCRRAAGRGAEAVATG